MEDVIEEMLQEPIYDEGDRVERQAMERAEWAFRKWRLFVKRRRKSKQREQPDDEQTPLVGNQRKQQGHEYGSGGVGRRKMLPSFLGP